MTEFSGPPATKKMYALSAIIEERTGENGQGSREPDMVGAFSIQLLV
jgi:hypothetical protein